MNLGKINHSYFGPCRTYSLLHTRVIEIKFDKIKAEQWVEQYQKYKNYAWDYCVFPINSTDTDVQQFRYQKVKQQLTPVYKIQYEGFYVVTLADEIKTRKNKKSNFTSSQILYMLLSLTRAWREWLGFCQKSQHTSSNFGISSSHILLNDEGDIKLITDFSSPLSMPKYQYYAPQNCPPNQETINSWNKSISFSIGLIGYQMAALASAESFYNYGDGKMKFNTQEYQKWMTLAFESLNEQLVVSKSDQQMKLVLNIITLLTDANPWIRLKIGELEAMLDPYKSSILDGDSVSLNRDKSQQSLLKYLKGDKQKQ